MKRLLMLPFFLAPLHAANISWDGGGDGTSWEDPANWNGDTVPAVGDDVTIDSAADPIITVANNLTVRSLNCEEEITFGGNLTLTGGNSTIKTSTFSDRSIFVSGGAVVQFPNLTTLAHPSNRDATLQADGAGSRLVFPAALSISGSGGISDDFFLRATDGGRLEFPLATEVSSGAVIFISDGADSLINITSLENFTGNLFTTLSGFRAINGGEIMSPALTSVISGEITADLPGVIDLSSVESIDGSGDVNLTGGVHDLSSLSTFGADFIITGGSVPLLTNLATLQNSSFTLSAGADLELPLVTDLGHNENRDNTFSCDGAGTRLSLPNVTTIVGSGGISDEFFFRVTNGGQLELSAATEVTSGAVLFSADGAGSTIDLNDLESFTGNLSTTVSGFRTSNGGSIATPSLLTVTDGEITSDTPGNFDFTQLNTILGNGMVTLTGGVHDLSALTTFKARMTIANGSVPTLTNLASLENASIFLTGGAVLNLPLVTSLSHDENRDNTFSADGAGSVLTFPNVTTITGPNGNSDELFIRATNSGRVEIANANEVLSGAVLFTADGANSLIDLSSLQSFSGNLFTTASGFRASNGGRIITSSLTNITEGEFTSDAPGNLDFAQL